MSSFVAHINFKLDAKCQEMHYRSFSNFLVTCFMGEILYVFLLTLFSLPLIFTLVTADYSFSHRPYKISCFISNEIGLR